MENIPKSIILKPNSTKIATLDKISGCIFFAVGTFCLFIAAYNDLIANFGEGYYPEAPQASSLFGWGAIVSFVIGIFVIVAGVLASRQKGWKFVLIGSGIAMLTIFGIYAFILTLKSKSEFTPLFIRSIADKSIKYCPICGQQNSQNANICETCGSKLSSNNSSS